MDVDQITDIFSELIMVVNQNVLHFDQFADLTAELEQTKQKRK